MADPIARVRVGTDEIGIYADGPDWLQLVHYDFQGDCVIEFPKSLARRLGRALLRIADGA